MLHLRSVPCPVALGEDDYAFVPPAAPSTGTDRFSTRSWRHIRPLIGTAALRMGKRYPHAAKLAACLAPRLYGFARAVKVRASLLPLRFHL
jgi:hypothetical protein